MRTIDVFARPLLLMLPSWLHPNYLVYARAAIAVPVFIAINNKWFAIGALLFIIGVCLDLVDGSLARVRSQVTARGALLDPIADKILFAASFLPLGFILLPANLFIAIIITEITTVLGTAAATSAWFLLYGAEPAITANRFGKYKTACYSIGTLLLFAAHWSVGFLIASILLFYLGLLSAILTIIEHHFHLAKH